MADPHIEQFGWTFLGGLTSTGPTALSGTTTVAAGATFTSPTITGAIINPKLVEYASDGVIALESHIAVLTKAGVNAMTIVAPTAAQNGTTIVITSATSNAHTVTLANKFWAGETGGPFDKITLAAFPGSSATIVAHGTLWLVVSDQIATVGD